MKVLVTYMTKTGNTKKVAEAIYGAIDSEKEIKPIEEVGDIGGYDLSFLGFPIHQEGPDKKTRELLAKHCTSGRNVALFITHASPEDGKELPSWIELFTKEAKAANIVGTFTCQGELAGGVKFMMKLMGKKYRTWAKMDNSQGQPDESRLEKARVFAKNVMSKRA